MQLLSRQAFPLASAVALVALSSNGLAQFEIEWAETLDSNVVDVASGVATDSSGNVYTVGSSRTSFSHPPDWVVMKRSPDGTLVWDTTVDWMGGDDVPFGVVADDSGNVYVAGEVEVPGSGQEFATARFDSAGNLVWMRTFQGAPGAGEDLAFRVALDGAGNVITVGRATKADSRLDACVVSWTAAGVLRWSRLIDFSAGGDDQGLEVAIGAGGQVYVACAINGLLGNLGDAGVAALDDRGNVMWQREIVGSDPSLVDVFQAITLAADGDVLLAGRLGDLTLGNQVLTVRYAADGTQEWSRLFDPGAVFGFADSIGEGSGGAVWVAGLAVEAGNLGALALRYTGDGTLASSEFLTLGKGQVGFGRVLVGNAGQAYVAGFLFDTTPFEIYVAQLDAEGETSWKSSFVVAGTDGHDLRDIALAPDGRVVLTAVSGNLLDGDFLTLQIDLRDSPQAYCTAKQNSQGCEPWASFTGLSSASETSGFEVRTDLVLNNKLGLFAYSVTGPAALPFGGGTLCVASPIRRAPPQTSGGNTGVQDCSGRFQIDWNAFAQGQIGGTPDPALLVPGTAVHCQSWGRDPGMAPPNNIQLSNALRFVVLP